MRILLLLILIVSNIYSLDILFGSNNHGAMYPCNCPRNPAGGLAKRAYLFDSLRVSIKEPLLVLNGGDFNAGGTYDMYSNNIAVEDSLRSLYTLYAMDEMKYDAIAVGDDDLNYGTDFLKKVNLPYVSANIFTDSTKSKRIFDGFKIVNKGNYKIGITSIVPQNKMTMGKSFYVSAPINELKKIYSDNIDSVDFFVVLNGCGQDSLESIAKIIAPKNVKKSFIFNAHFKKGMGYLYNINDIPVVNFKYIEKSIHHLSFNIDSAKITNMDHINLGTTIGDNKNVAEIVKEYEHVKRRVLQGLYGKLELDLYVMIDCPYCNIAYKELLPFVNRNYQRVKLNVHYLMDNEDEDAHDNMLQIALQKIDYNKFLSYLELKYMKGVSDMDALDSVGVTLKSLNDYLNSDAGKRAVQKNKDLVKKYDVHSTPTLFIDGEQYNGLLEIKNVLSKVCKFYNFKECLNVSECYVDEDCQKTGLIGSCDTTLEKNVCVYKSDQKFTFYVIYDERAFYTFDSTVISETQKVFPSVEVEYLDYRDEKAKSYLQNLHTDKLPLYIADSRIEKASKFEDLKSFFQKKYDFYELVKVDADNFILSDRDSINGIEVLVSPHAPNLMNDSFFDVVEKLIDIKKVKSLGYIVYTRDNKLHCLGGNYELETVKRMVAINSYYKNIFTKYLKLWRENPETSYWEEPLDKLSMNSKNIKKYAHSKSIDTYLERYSSVWDETLPDHYLYVLINNREVIKVNEGDIFKVIDSIK